MLSKYVQLTEMQGHSMWWPVQIKLGKATVETLVERICFSNTNAIRLITFAIIASKQFADEKQMS